MTLSAVFGKTQLNPTTFGTNQSTRSSHRAVRALNSGLPKERRLRVLLGDPPVDSAAIHTRF